MSGRIGLLTLTLLGAGCATKSDVVDLESTVLAEFAAVRARQDSLSGQIAQLRPALLDSLAEQERRSRSGLVELQRRVDDLNASLAQLIELTGQVQRRFVAPVREPGPAEGAPSPEGGPPAGEAGGGGEGETDLPTGAATGAPEELYEASLRQLRRGSHLTARAGLEEFLRRYPAHDLAPDARYYLAETYAAADDPQAALREYARVLELHPASRRAPAALYKSGLLELDRGNVDDARAFFQRVVRGYPDSDEAGPAREQLQKLQR